MNHQPNPLATDTLCSTKITFDWRSFICNCNQLKRTLVSVYQLNNHQFRFFNTYSGELLGYRIHGLLKRHMDQWLSLVHHEDYPELKKQFLRQCSQKKAEGNVIFKYRIKNGEGRWIVVRHEQTGIRSGSEYYIISLITNVSEREMVFRQLKSNWCDKPEIDLVKSRFLNPEFSQIISSRELEVLLLIASGLSSKEIADSLCISNHTAITHRKNLIEKFKVRNTAHLIKEASKMIRLD